MKDNVKCTNCGFEGLVGIGQEECPVCMKRGCLMWVDDDKQEVEDDYLDKKEKT